MKITKVGPVNLKDVMKIENDSFTDEAFPEKTWEEILKDPSCTTYGIIDEDEIKGIITYRHYEEPKADFFHIISAGVLKKARRQGNGKKLLDYMTETILKKYSSRDVFIIAETRKSNTPMKKILEKRGFKLTQILKDYYPGEDGLRYVLKI